ncbi:hypothetical protein ACQPXB_39595 [Amycolatopsis sp. CA-161197]|uniref:hypothetical protein n=1 Tax=unclassified Amycolatopsis TaxID=2618356 RepID=UPI0036CCC049
MTGPFVFIATNSVVPGRFDAEKSRAPGWARFVDGHEPRLIAFHEYASADGTEVEFVQIHPDTDSFEHHLRVLSEHADPEFRENLTATTSIRVHGTPTEAILTMLRDLAGAGVPITFFPHHLGGFTRR